MSNDDAYEVEPQDVGNLRDVMGEPEEGPTPLEMGSENANMLAEKMKESLLQNPSLTVQELSDRFEINESDITNIIDSYLVDEESRAVQWVGEGRGGGWVAGTKYEQHDEPLEVESRPIGDESA